MAVDVEIQIQQLFQRNRTDTCCISICPVVSMTQIKIQEWNYSRKTRIYAKIFCKGYDHRKKQLSEPTARLSKLVTDER